MNTAKYRLKRVMTMPEFTKSQLQAINTVGKSLIVSAGAGSGKTTVLTQRIIRSLKDGGDIDDILVVTFTKAAASDMKEKLYNALLAASADDIESRRLSEMSMKISSARISTISSFCFRFVKDNFELLGLSPRLRMADDGESSQLLSECLALVEEEALEREDADMLLLADTFSGDKNFNRLDSIILEIYQKFRSAPFWKNRFEKAIAEREKERELCEKEGFFSCKSGRSILSDIVRRLGTLKKRSEKLLEFAEYAATTEKHLTALEKLCKDISDIYGAGHESYELLSSAIHSFSADRLYSVGMERDAVEHIRREKSAVTAEMSKLKELCSFTEKQICDDYNSVIELNKALRSFVFRLDEVYTAEKNRRGICDYADAEHLALKLLGRRTDNGVVRTELCKRYSAGISEIYVDEYQDVNPLQDMIFSLLSRADNSFFVGDVKQSIYRFRNASARIFGDRVQNAPSVSDEGKIGKIFLQENFRCSENIIDFVNSVFQKLYTPENTGYSYENEKLICGLENTCKMPVMINCITDTESGKRDECEATVAAARILSLVGRAKKSDGSMVKYGDIAVLMRSASGRAADYEKVFRRHGIPFTAENDSHFLDQPEIMLAVSLLTVIDDPTDEIALAASMRSPIFCFDADELKSVRDFRGEAPYYFAVSACAKEYIRKTAKKTYKCSERLVGRSFAGNRRKSARGKRPDIGVLKKCFDFITVIKSLAEAAIELPSHKLIWKMYEETRMIQITSCFEHGEEKKNNLMSLYKMAVSYESGVFRGLSAFLEYLQSDADRTDSALTLSDDCVRIMTFHKSKGLEFPVCIVCGTGSDFNVKDLRLPYVVCGDGFVCFDLKAAEGLCSYQPLVKLAAVSDEKKEMLCEELRCLYVALTRAREQLYVTGCFKGDADDIAEKDFFDQSSNLERIINAVNFSRSKSFIVDTMMADALPTPDVLRLNSMPTVISGDIDWDDYEYRDALTLPAKVAVSELRVGLLEDDEYNRSVSRGAVLKKPSFVDGDKVTPAERGTATHMFMQFCSFEGVEAHGVGEEAKRLKKIGALSEHEAGAIRINELEKFFSSELYKEMRSAAICRREMRFTLVESSSLIGKNAGEEVLVQGVIDCFFQNEDGSYTVVDYKTDRISEESELIDRHRSQISYYCRAVSKMTGKKVSRCVLYSFALGREIDVEVTE